MHSLKFFLGFLAVCSSRQKVAGSRQYNIRFHYRQLSLRDTIDLGTKYLPSVVCSSSASPEKIGSPEKEKHITSRSKTVKQRGAEGIRDRGPSRRADTCSVVSNHYAPRELHCESLGPFLGRSITLLFSASIFLGQRFCHPVIFVRT